MLHNGDVVPHPRPELPNIPGLIPARAPASAQAQQSAAQAAQESTAREASRKDALVADLKKIVGMERWTVLKVTALKVANATKGGEKRVSVTDMLDALRADLTRQEATSDEKKMWEAAKQRVKKFSLEEKLEPQVGQKRAAAGAVDVSHAWASAGMLGDEGLQRSDCKSGFAGVYQCNNGNGGRFYSKVGTQGTSAYWYSGAFPTAIEAARARRDHLSTQQGTETKLAVTRSSKPEKRLKPKLEPELKHD